MLQVAWDAEPDGERTGVVVVTLDRPERRNAVDHTTLLELADAQLQAATARALVLTGSGPIFCAGADLTGVEDAEFARTLGLVLRGFTSLTLPTIAAVGGDALGAGAQLAVACDLRVAAPGSRFGIPAAKLGLVVDHWTVRRLGQELGWATARAMLLAAETYDAEALHGAGSVHRLGSLADAVAWARQLATLAPLTIAGHKLALERLAPEPDVDDLVEAARAMAWASADASEGRRAFLEKRRPAFRGE